jgi:hypothetical protein
VIAANHNTKFSGLVSMSYSDVYGWTSIYSVCLGNCFAKARGSSYRLKTSLETNKDKPQ